MRKITERMIDDLAERIWYCAIYKVKELLNINQNIPMNFLKMQADQFEFRCTGEGVLPRYEIRYLTIYKSELKKVTVIVNNLESMLSLKSKFKKFNYKEKGTTRLIKLKDIISEDINDTSSMYDGNIEYHKSFFEKLYKISNYKSTNFKDDVYLFDKKKLMKILNSTRCESFSITPLGSI